MDRPALICKVARERKGIKKKDFIFGFVSNVHFMCTFLFFAVMLVGWLVGWHNLIILWGDRAIYPEKGLLATTYQEKTFSSSIFKKLHNWRIISYHCNSLDWVLHVCTEGQPCYWPDIDLCLVGKKKGERTFDLHFNIFFLDLFESSSWDWEWHQRLKSEKEFSFPHSKSVPHQASLL